MILLYSTIFSLILINANLFILNSFEVEFSIPKKIKPIPEGTVKVYFTVMEAEEGTTGTEGYDVEFNFENESLKHRIGNTMRSNMYEVSLLIFEIHE